MLILPPFFFLYDLVSFVFLYLYFSSLFLYRMDTRTVVGSPIRGRVQRDYRERIIVTGIERYVFITSRRNLREGSRTILIQSIAMGPMDCWRLFERLPEIFSRFCAATFGDFRGWSDTIAVTVHEVIEALNELNNPWESADRHLMWPRNFTFIYRRGVDQESWYQITYC